MTTLDALSLKARPLAKTSMLVRSKLMIYNKPVVFSKEALLHTLIYVGKVALEVGWLGTVEEKEDYYYVDKVYLFKQEVSGASTDLDAEDIEKFILEIGEKEGPEVAGELNNKLRFWGHSHVKMDVNPSGTDNDTMEEQFGMGNMPFAIRAIANKLGEMKVDVYRFDIGMQFHDVPWWEEGDDFSGVLEAVEKEIDEKVSEKKYQAPTGGATGANWKTGQNTGALTLIEKTDLGDPVPWWKNGLMQKQDFFDEFFGIESGGEA